jgi:hypothetical protein
LRTEFFHKESLVISNIQTQDMGFDRSRRWILECEKGINN